MPRDGLDLKARISFASKASPDLLVRRDVLTRAAFPVTCGPPPLHALVALVYEVDRCHDERDPARLNQIDRLPEREERAHEGHYHYHEEVRAQRRGIVSR